MPITTLPIANGFYLSDSLPISAQECTNWYPNLVQTEGLSQETLFGTPGLNQLATSGLIKQINRGARTLVRTPYFVNGDDLYRVDRTVVDDVETFAMSASLGTIDFGTLETDRVSMSDNGTQLFIMVPGGKGFIFTEGPDTLTEITDGDFTANGAPQHVVFVDGFFLLTTDTKKFIISDLNDGLSYNALDFGTAESDPDDIVAPIVFKNQVFIGGGKTIEAFQNIPQGADFPFVRTNLFLDKGISSAFSIVNTSDTFMWIGAGNNESPAIWQLAGNSVQKVSTTAIDSILQGFTEDEITASFSWTYAQKGAYFVGFALPSTTLVIDTITGRWHERKSQIINAKNVTETLRFRVNSIVTAFGRLLAGDSVDGRIGEIDPDVFTEYAGPIIRRIATQPFQNNMKSFKVPWLELTVESGVGDNVVVDPKMSMDISVDGGKKFRDPRIRSMGKTGEFTRRVIWRRVNRVARFVVFRFTLSDAVKPVIIQLTANIK